MSPHERGDYHLDEKRMTRKIFAPATQIARLLFLTPQIEKGIIVVVEHVTVRR